MAVEYMIPFALHSNIHVQLRRVAHAAKDLRRRHNAHCARPKLRHGVDRTVMSTPVSSRRGSGQAVPLTEKWRQLHTHSGYISASSVCDYPHHGRGSARLALGYITLHFDAMSTADHLRREGS